MVHAPAPTALGDQPESWPHPVRVETPGLAGGIRRLHQHQHGLQVERMLTLPPNLVRCNPVAISVGPYLSVLASRTLPCASLRINGPSWDGLGPRRKCGDTGGMYQTNPSTSVTPTHSSLSEEPEGQPRPAHSWRWHQGCPTTGLGTVQQHLWWMSLPQQGPRVGPFSWETSWPTSGLRSDHFSEEWVQACCTSYHQEVKMSPPSAQP